MNAKKLSISIFLIVFILFAAVSALVYDRSEGVKIICFEDSYAEEYAKKHDLECQLISDSEAYLGIVNLENYDYNNDGTLVAYKGDSEKIAIPESIEGITITKVTEKAFEDAKNIKSIYLPKSVTAFEVKEPENVTVYLYEDTDLYKKLSKDKDIKFEIKTIADSYFVDFYTGDIPFGYDNTSDKTVEINRYYGEETALYVPESIDGKIVTAISFDALENGVKTLVIPESITKIEEPLYKNRYDLTFLIGLLMAFAGMLLAVILVAVLKIPTKEKAFLNVAQFIIAYALVALSLALAGVYLYLGDVSNWFIYALLAVVFGFAIVAMLSIKASVVTVENVGEKVAVQTLFIKSLTATAEYLMNTSKTAEFKALTKKVYEAVRYSDPMSNAVLVETEEKIQNGFDDFENAVMGDDFELACSTADELLSLIDVRNKKCKLLK